MRKMQIYTTRQLFILVLLTASLFGCAAKNTDMHGASSNAGKALEQAMKAYDSNEYGQSLEILDATVQAGKADARVFNARGVLFLRARQYARAQTDFESAVLLDTASAQYRYNLALALMGQRKIDEALRSVNEALRNNPEYGEAYLLKGTISLSRNDAPTALVSLDKAVALLPDDFGALYNRGLARLNAEMYTEAERDFTRCLELEPNSHRAMNNRGLCMYYAERYDAAVRDFASALQKNASSADYYFNRGLAFKRLWQYKEAVGDFTRAISYGAGFAEAYEGRGEVYLLLGKDSAGCADFRQACDLGNCISIERYEDSGRCKSE